MKKRSIDDVTSAVLNHYISRGFIDCTDKNSGSKWSIRKYYDGYMSISFCDEAKSNSYISFIVKLDGICVNQESNSIKFGFNLMCYNPITGVVPLTDEDFKRHVIESIEYNIDKRGSDKLKSHYKSILRNEKLKLLGV